MSDINATLHERHATHGSFADNARIAQMLRHIMRAESSWYDLDPVMREALDMSASKLSRILSTTGRNIDDWHDLAGYATLVEKHLQGESL
jgi:hypothetical protein